MAIVINGTGTIAGVSATGITTAPTNATDTTKLPLAGGTMTGNIAGFTSTGIDDNATGTKVTVSDTGTTVVGFIKSDSIAPAPGGLAAPGVSLNWYKIGSLALHLAQAGVLTVLGTKDYSGVGAISAESKLILRGGTVNTTLAGHYSANSQGSATPQFAWKNTASGVFDIYASNAQFGNLNSYYKGEGSWNASYSDTGSTSLPTGSTAFVSKYGISIDGAANFMFDSNGLKFNGDTAAANALDDYEEGTWTAAFATGGGSITIDSTFKTGWYTKIGRTVHCILHARVGSLSSPSSYLVILGLPFASNSDNKNRTAGSIAATPTAAPVNTSIVCYNSSGSSNIAVNGFSQDMINAAGYIEAATEIYIGISYNV